MNDPTLTRRRLLTGAAVSTALVALDTVRRPTPAFAHHLASTGSVRGGVNTHLSFFNTPYGNADLVANKLLWLECKIARDSWAPPGQGSDWYKRWNAAVLKCRDVAGVKWIWHLPGGYDPAQLDYYLDGLENGVAANVVAGIEPPNEPDANGYSDAQIIEGQQRLFEAVNARSALAKYAVFGPATYKSTARRIGSLGPYMDIGGWHIYFTKRPIDTWAYNDSYDAAMTLSGGKKLLPTETNFIIGDGYTNLANAAGEEEQRKGFEEIMLAHHQAGLYRAICYELLNGSDPKFKSTHRENNFGCFRADGSIKPLAYALREACRRDNV